MANIYPFHPPGEPDPAETDSGFSADQVETLGVAFAGLRDDLTETSGAQIAAALVQAKAELVADFDEKLTTALIRATTKFSGETEARIEATRSEATDSLRVEFRQRLERSVKAFRDEIELTVAAVRSELLAKLDQSTYGLMLTDIDPLALEHAIKLLGTEVNARLQAGTARVEEIAADLGRHVDRNELAELQRRIDLLQSRIASGQRLTKRRADGQAPKGWRIDAETYCATLILVDGTALPPLDLKPLFQRFADETGDN
jgi:hypothetical protein